ncbi:ACT domain-containing protein [Microbulbifer spongiae]|uniref:ACT domain-containing protein n=1 Tax=Microbulbifer spongiae TaxID=2944933 RepID=A0ABY9EEY7_9GAMM|nr:ACT domain-containing protein [Microbulbifer sp. MI-G]WKD49925.1 ACT domain-containing protein [Microbulbifer sp. MI-G]
MCPRLQEETYVFCQVANTRLMDVIANSLCIFREGEGMSVILPRNLARQHGLVASAPFRLITLQIVSGFSAIQLTAIVAGALADAGIVANVVTVLRHDHIFVPEDSAERALQLLRGISNRAYYT